MTEPICIGFISYGILCKNSNILGKMNKISLIDVFEIFEFEHIPITTEIPKKLEGSVCIACVKAKVSM